MGQTIWKSYSVVKHEMHFSPWVVLKKLRSLSANHKLSKILVLQCIWWSKFPFEWQLLSQTFSNKSLFFSTYRSDLEHLRSVFIAVENGDIGMLKSLGIKDSELGDVKFFLEKLVNTGFLDWVAPEHLSPFYYSVPINSQFYSYLENSIDGYNF